MHSEEKKNDIKILVEISVAFDSVAGFMTLMIW